MQAENTPCICHTMILRLVCTADMYSTSCHRVLIPVESLPSMRLSRIWIAFTTVRYAQAPLIPCNASRRPVQNLYLRNKRCLSSSCKKSSKMDRPSPTQHHHSRPSDLYDELVASGKLIDDPAQRLTCQTLDSLHDAISEALGPDMRSSESPSIFSQVFQSVPLASEY